MSSSVMPNPGPCDAELGLAVVKVRAGPPSDAEGRLAVDSTFPPPLRRMRRRAGAFHDPADRQAAPDNLIVVGITVPVDHGGAQGYGFVVGHSAIMSQYRLSENLQLLDRAVCCTGDLHGPRRPPKPLIPRRGPCPRRRNIGRSPDGKMTIAFAAGAAILGIATAIGIR